MPTYDYICQACGHHLEAFHSMTQKPLKNCPACKRPKLERQLGAGAGFIFKGTGFYLTDYRSDSYKAGQKGESMDQKESAKSEAKSEKPVIHKKSAEEGSAKQAKKKPSADA